MLKVLQYYADSFNKG